MRKKYVHILASTILSLSLVSGSCLPVLADDQISEAEFGSEEIAADAPDYSADEVFWTEETIEQNASDEAGYAGDEVEYWSDEADYSDDSIAAFEDVVIEENSSEEVANWSDKEDTAPSEKQDLSNYINGSVSEQYIPDDTELNTDVILEELTESTSVAIHDPDLEGEISTTTASGWCGTNAKWSFNDGKLTISGSDLMDNYQLKEDPVTNDRISTAPWASLSVKKVVIEDGITSIGKYAFMGCSEITEISIPDTVLMIGEYAFYECRSLERVTIPESVYHIDKYTFYGCYSLTNVEFPAGLLAIGEYAFMRCTSLGNIVIPNGVTTITSHAFAECNSAKSVILPARLSYIKDNAFYQCVGLKSIDFPDGLLSIDESAFSGCTGLEKIEIPNRVTKIENDAFGGCSSVSSVIIPDSVTAIGSSAFFNCRGLSNVTIPGKVKTIEKYAFALCTGLFSITIPESVTSIDNDAFASCSEYLAIYGKPGSYAESYAKNNGIKFVSEGSGQCGKNLTWEFNDVTLTISGNGLMYDYPSKEDPDTEEKIYTVPWAGFPIKKVVIEKGVSSIGAYAFEDCNEITEVSIPDTVQMIGGYAFDNCSSLVSVSIPDGVTAISQGLFRECTNLVTVELPESVLAIGNSAFFYCESLVNIEIPSSVMNIGSRAFSGCSSLKQVVIPSGVAIIDDSAFSVCSSLSNIVIPSSVRTIEKYAFFGCKGLKSIDLPDEIQSIGEFAFFGCKSLVKIQIPKGVTKIEKDTFDSCTSVGSLLIPDSVIEIGEYAFLGCRSLSAVIIPESVKTIGKSAFIGCLSLSSITIPESVTNIGENAFIGCSTNKTIYGKSGSYAETYAKNNNIRFIPITISIKGAEVSGLEDAVYTGSQIMPIPLVTVNGKNLVLDQDYTVTYVNNVNAGTATVTLTGKGDYIDSITAEFSILQAHIKNAKIADITPKSYTGAAYNPKLTIKYKGVTLKKLTDYQVSYKNSTNAGIATATVKGLGNFKGTVVMEYPILQLSIAKAKVTGIETKVYTGKAISQNITVILDSMALKKGTDYTVSYKNNKNVGVATITIKGIGNYKGTLNKTFVINPKVTSLNKVTAGTKQFTATWKKNSTQTTGYQIQYSTSKSFASGNTTKTVSKTSATSLKVSKLKGKKTYYVRIRTYKKVGSKTYYSAWSSVKSVTTK